MKLSPFNFFPEFFEFLKFRVGPVPPEFLLFFLNLLEFPSRKHILLIVFQKQVHQRVFLLSSLQSPANKIITPFKNSPNLVIFW